MSFTSKIKEHLSKYKSENFPELGKGRFKNNNQYYTHILPEENKFENLLKPYKEELQNYISNSKIKEHKDFHHLNSSQAMCFNFFFPLFREHKLELITDFIGLKNEKINYESICFEKDGLERKLGSNRPTSFDFYFETISNKKVYFEIKYTEESFGSSTLNKANYEKYYSKNLNSINPKFHKAELFYNDYQILRNLIHIQENSFVVFVYPKENKPIKKQIERVVNEFLTPEFQDNFHNVHWDKILKQTSKLDDCEKLKEQFTEFKLKYLPK